MVNTYAVQSGGCRFESLWGFGFLLKGAHYEVDYSGKKTYLAGLQCTLTSSCAISKRCLLYEPQNRNRKVSLIGIVILQKEQGAQKNLFSVNQNLQLWMLRIFSKKILFRFPTAKISYRPETSKLTQKQ